MFDPTLTLLSKIHASAEVDAQGIVTFKNLDVLLTEFWPHCSQQASLMAQMDKASTSKPTADQMRAVIQFGAVLIANLVRNADKPNGRAEAIFHLKAWAEAATSEEFSEALTNPEHVDPARSLRLSSACEAYQMHRGASQEQVLRLLIEDVFLRGIPESIDIPLKDGQLTREVHRVNSKGRRIHGFFSYNNMTVIGWADGYLKRPADPDLMSLIDDPDSLLASQYRNGQKTGSEQRAKTEQAEQNRSERGDDGNSQQVPA